jgi:ERCC4-type nuclease
VLLVDDRIGSKDLLGPLQQRGVPAELAHLDFGDFAFVGRGISDDTVTIGVELKETRDLISSLQSSRFAGHQLPGLIENYDRVWLLTEGIWREGDGGILETMVGGWRPVSVGPKRIMAGDLERWILTQTIRGGINHWHSPTRRDTLRFLSSLYHWWVDSSLDEHRSHQAIYTAPPDRATFVEPSVFRKMIAQLHGIGWEKSLAVEEHFGTISVMVAATTEEWMKIPGIGKTLADRSVETLHGIR